MEIKLHSIYPNIANQFVIMMLRKIMKLVKILLFHKVTLKMINTKSIMADVRINVSKMERM
jgi:hypothetical protein